MRIAFNPSTVAALTAPPDNKDITFDLRGHNIFARGVKFCGTDTNTWRDIKINNVSIDSNILDLRNGSNTTLTNTNGVVTINSTWRPVVDNLTSDSTTSSLSANQGRILAELINGKSDSDHNHDDRYLRLTGGWMSGDIAFGSDNKIYWGRNTDSASISFKNDGDGDADSYMSFVTSDNGNEYFRWSHSSGSTNIEWMSLRSDGLRVGGTKVSLEGHTHDDRYVKKSGDTMLGALNFANGTWNLVGDNSYMGDCNISGHFGIKAANTTYPGIAFFNNANAHLGSLTAYSSNIKYGAYSLQFLDNGNTSVSASTWMNPFSDYNSNAVADGQAVCVWGQSSYLSNLANDTGDMSLWLKRVNTNVATLNMVLDGEYYANGNQRLAHVSEIPNSLKNPHALTISLNGTSQGPYDGSAAKNINITPSSIGAATSGHNHDSSYVKYTKVTKSTADNANALPYLYNVENEEVISGYYKYWYIFNMGQYSGGNFGTQIAMPYQDSLTDSELFIRSAKSGSWRTWRRILHSNNYTAYTVTKNGTGANGTWGISITGNADTVDGVHANQLCRIYTFKVHNSIIKVGTLTSGQYGHVCKLRFNSGIGYNAGNQDKTMTVVIRASNGRANSKGFYFEAHSESYRGGAFTTFYLHQTSKTQCELYMAAFDYSGQSTYEVSFSNGDSWANEISVQNALPTSDIFTLPNYQIAYTDYNVASATKLQTSRTIWGQSFDGTADVNGTIYINNSDSSNGAIRLNNNVNSNARISAISDQVIFNTGNAIRFGETAWDWNQWAGLKYTHFNKTIYLGIADGSEFNANSAQSNGILRLAGIKTITLNPGARIGNSGGDLYLGNANNSAWVKVQDICSHFGSDYWYIYQDGNATFTQIKSKTNAYIVGNLEARQIIRGGSDQMWVNGRNGALLRETSAAGYHTLWSLKTTDGSWDFGEYNAGSDWNNIPVLSYITDSNYNSGNNTPTYQIRFPLASGTVALTNDINNYYWANVKISTSSSTTTSPTVHTLTATRVCAGHNPEIDNSISCSNWFRSSGSTGWYNTTYYGGWYMSDTSWIRAHNGVGIYTSGQIYSSSSIRMGNILLQNTNEINNSANGNLNLNQRSSGNITLCYGGGNVGIGTSPLYKLDVAGEMRSRGFHYAGCESDDYILLAGGGVSSIKYGETSAAHAVQIGNYVWLTIHTIHAWPIKIVPNNISNPNKMVAIIGFDRNSLKIRKFNIKTDGCIDVESGDKNYGYLSIYTTTCYVAGN